MARLTLETEQFPCPWPTIEAKLGRCLSNMERVSQDQDKRSYRLRLPEQDEPLIALLQELQALLAPEDLHFFIDLNP